MAWRCGSLSRSLLSSVRTSSIRSTSRNLPRVRPAPLPQLHTPRNRALFTSPSRTLGLLGCTQSMLPLHSAVAAARLTSHLTGEARACCELSQGT